MSVKNLHRYQKYNFLTSPFPLRLDLSKPNKGEIIYGVTRGEVKVQKNEHHCQPGAQEGVLGVLPRTELMSRKKQDR